MKPILYESTATSFNTNGLGILNDAISCVVTEERNGSFELEMDYPISGIHYSDIAYRRILKAKPNPHGTFQPFRIYKISRPLNGVITVYAQHISYDLTGIPVTPYSADSLTLAFMGFSTYAAISNPFTFSADFSGSGTFTVDVPSSIRSLLGGQKGSILDVYGGEYEWNGYAIYLHASRGSDRGVRISYGKNLTDLTQEENISNMYTGVLPYWTGSDGALQQGSIVYASGTFSFTRILSLDMTSDFDAKPTAAQLEAAAVRYIKNNNIGVPSVSLSVSFQDTAPMTGTALYDEVDLCDTVHVFYSKLGVTATANCVKTVYDVILERYDSIELGDARTNIADTIADQSKELETKVTNAALAQAIQTATDLITGVDGGYLVINRDSSGKPYELLIMDTADIASATKVWRWNQNGLGYSSTGYNGTYALAMTVNGSIVADFVTTGTMSAARIKGGVLQLGGNSNGNGVLQILDASGNQIGRWDNTGITATEGTFSGTVNGASIIVGGSGNSSGTITVKNASGTTICTINSDGIIVTGTSHTIKLNGSRNLGDSTIGGIDIEGSSVSMFLSDTGLTIYTTGTTDGSYLFDLAQNGISDSESTWGYTKDWMVCTGGATINGSLDVSGEKNRIVQTKHYSCIKMGAYETPTPMFGDIGSGIIGDDGKCYVMMDPILAETINPDCDYQVFLQAYGHGKCFVSKRDPARFIVSGTPGMEFGWELKGRQLGYENHRFDRKTASADTDNSDDYATLGQSYIKKYMEEQL
jgi:phage minor structural protein